MTQEPSVNDVWSVDPRTGAPVELVARETTPAEVATVCAAALEAAPLVEAMGRQGREKLLESMAEALEGRRDDIVSLADRALGTGRLGGELTRTCYQLRLELREDFAGIPRRVDGVLQPVPARPMAATA
jgi:NADP-dependent aldehyde dehydrogenase